MQYQEFLKTGGAGPTILPPPPADGGSNEAAAAPTTTPAAAAGEEGGRAFRPRRGTKNQVGRLWIVDTYSRQPAGIVRPKADLMVQWEAPYSLLQELGQPEIALFRLGVSSNTNAVISKSMSVKPPPPPQEGQPPPTAKGQITFYAPRSAGIFVFRMFDAADPVDTHATSRRFLVEVQGRDVESNLRLISSQLKERKTVVAGLSQLGVLLRDLRPFQPGRQYATLLWTCLHLSVGHIEEGQEEKPEGSGGGEKTRSRYPVITGVAGVLQATLCNRFVFSSLSPQQREYIKEAEARWCPFTEEFYASEQAKEQHYREAWGLVFNTLPANAIPPSICLSLSKEMDTVLPSLYPSPAFFQKREEVRARVEAMLPLLGEALFPPGTRLRVFGSSANNFGNDAADLDMCVTFPPETPMPAGGAGEMIEALAAHLEENGMSEVVPRPTARIPIVLFTDPDTGLDCDISVENPLALRNTQLLHMYSRVDPRVRALAYIVKHWARCRKINNASGGTLSSYAYILMVLHFLQTRHPTPIVPNLQLLPPDWNGQETDRRELIRRRVHNPHVLVTHPLEKVEVDTYFYTPPAETDPEGRLLRAYAARNQAPVGALLVDFFRYYTWEFDYREHVLSVRAGGVLRKEEKAEEDGWAVNARLAVEDPFETWYNVSHFLKEGKHRHIRQEFARAYTMCAEEALRLAAGKGKDGEKEEGKEKEEEASADLLARICEEAPEPPPRKQTVDDEEALAALVAAMGEGGLEETGKEGEGGPGEGGP